MAYVGTRSSGGGLFGWALDTGDSLICAGRREAAGGRGQVRRDSGGGGKVVESEAAVGIIKERTAMILGMNPRPLRDRRKWAVYLWPKRRHWALVLQPLGEAFSARIVDDFVHSAQGCFNVEEMPSSKLFLVYELLVDQGSLFLMLSAKPDFMPDRQPVRPLGVVGPLCIQDLEAHALAVVRRYRSYSYIGCNCQHFATDFAISLGATARIVPEDEAVAHAASEGALALGAAGVTVAATAAAGAAGASVLGAASGAPTALFTAVPLVLTTVAASAFAVGVAGGMALVGVAGGYRAIYEGLRDRGQEGGRAATDEADDDEEDEEGEEEVRSEASAAPVEPEPEAETGCTDYIAPAAKGYPLPPRRPASAPARGRKQKVAAVGHGNGRSPSACRLCARA